MRTKALHSTLMLALCLAAAPHACASGGKAAPLPPDPAMDPALVAAGFLDHHPDLRYRMEAMRAYEAGRFEQARGLFERAALYADKPSQGMVAEMLWKGEGVARDRALAYAWMDLAAERGYRPMLILRERYWSELDEAERADALARGQEVYARYGDAVAKPRYANVLRRGRMQVTGSRTGMVGSLTIVVPMAGEGEQVIDGAKFYDPRYWQPEKYWAWQDAVWEDLRQGQVNVGDPEKVEPSTERPKR